MAIANSASAEAYFAAIHAEIGGLSVLHWINDALMALFFLLVGLEIKREMIAGELSTWPSRALPGIAALGGMAAPAALYAALNAGSGEPLRGWAVPTATDIAFALGVLSLLGPRVPASLKVFLAALAIIDDLGAVLIIAFVYTGDLDLPALAGAGLVALLLAGLNRSGVRVLAPYLLLGLVLWALVFLSGVHATVAGVVLALAIPLRDRGRDLQPNAPLQRLEDALSRPVNFLIVPLFGFANAGLSFAGLTFERLLDPVPLGVALGLFLGKQAGVFLASLATIRLGLAQRPAGAGWLQFYGVALLCGIGFTMSLFVGLLAFPASPLLQDEVKLGVIAGSLASAAVGALVLLLSGRRRAPSGASAERSRGRA